MDTELSSTALRVLENNSRNQGDRFYFTADCRKYPFQYYWDSCFQAIAMSLFDGARAQQEMYSLLSTQFADGCMPYLTSWDRPPLTWRIFLKTANWIGEDGRANMSTQPMMSAVAAWEIYKRTGDVGFLERVIPELAREADYLGVQRNLLDDGLVVIVNALESGMNESPVYDEIMGMRRPKGLGPLVHLLYYVKLSRQMAGYKDVGYDLDRVAALGFMLAEDITSNSLFCRSLDAMGSILSEVGEDRAAAEYSRQAVLLAERLQEACWDEEDAFFYTRYGSREGRKFSRVKTVSGLLPLFTGLISRDRADAMVERHLVDEREFWTVWPVPCVSVDEPSYRGWVFPSPFPSLWRGGTWVNINWLLFMGLMEYGYREIARSVAEKTVEMVRRCGFREFYNSGTGKGYGGTSYGMSTLAVDMFERLEGESPSRR